MPTNLFPNRRVCCVLLGCAAWIAWAPAAAEPVDAQGIEFFEKKVRPLLVQHCYECHATTAKQIRGGLSLDHKAGWTEGGDSGPAIVPGNPDESILIQAVRYELIEMPPKGKLSKAEIATLEQWVRMGAPDPRTEAVAGEPSREGIDFEEARQFWAFQPPERHAAPPVKDEEWPVNALDHFILARLEAKNLRPVREADPAALLRRLTYDLTGLPPTVEELEAFTADPSTEAYAATVDRLLASPRFGEQWGRHWLDLARYADSNGGDINLTYHNAWRYRDYVIDAFNSDQPYDQFLREQVAGDQLPAKTEADRTRQLVATGLLMIGPKMLSERDKEKLYLDVADEQLDSLGKIVLGLTLGCARCHDHKFDPIPTSDYYALAGILRSTETVNGIRMNNVNVSGWVEQPLPMEPKLERQVSEFNRKADEIKGRIAKAKDTLKSVSKESRLLPGDLLGTVVDDSKAKLVGEWKRSTYSPRYVGDGYIHDDKKDKGQKSVTFVPDLPASGSYEVRICYAASNGRAKAVPVVVKHAGGETIVPVNQEPAPEIGGLFKSLGRFEFDKGTNGFVSIRTQGTDGYVIADAAQFIPVELLKGKDDDISMMDAGVRIQRRTSELNKTIKQMETELAKLQKTAPPVPMAMAARDYEKPADCRICVRGEPHNRGEAVPRGFLTVTRFEGEPEVDGTKSGRLALAEWLSHPSNPLTARVMVNRIWRHLLGVGIVPSVDNFGKLGDRPSHPELLDTLAVEFMAENWSVKRTIRKIVLSRTYRLASANDSKCSAIDPENRLLWRHNRKRLTAESLRDAMLRVSGQLDLRAGGSSVADLGEQAIANTANQEGGVDHQGNVRRSIYLPILRSDLPPFLTVFDFADPEMATGDRPTTTVPAQSLLMMNSPFARRCSMLFAQALLGKIDLDDSARLDVAFLAAYGRKPNPNERDRLLGHVRQIMQSAEEQGDEQDRRKRAWTEVCQVLIAATEFRFVE